MNPPDRTDPNDLSPGRATGPRTNQGKATSSKNAIRHGLTSKQSLAPGEIVEDFEEFARELLEGLAPVGSLEQLMAERVISSAWRARRAARFEVAQLTHEVAVSRKVALPGQEPMGVALGRLAKSDALSKVTRYEAAIERSLYRALHELQRLQALRSGQVVTAPMVVDFEGPGRE